ncbi:transposase [Streptomyces sp. NPDC059352]|uniref:transposase n=1 Tax=Streptomyces sp. NPDC059352 TaxID=3346810 RepID=UPI0036C7974A
MREAVAATRTTLTTLPGLGTVLAAKVIGHIGDVSRFPTEHHFASDTGSAPLDASSGNNVRHRLITGGNRAAELGPAHHRRLPDPRRRARAGLLPPRDQRGKDAFGSPQGPKRRLPNVVYRIMKRDQRTHLAQAA